MKPNQRLLRSLGLADTGRVVLIHTDDIGMCHASLAAYMDLVRPDGPNRTNGYDRLNGSDRADGSDHARRFWP